MNNLISKIVSRHLNAGIPSQSSEDVVKGLTKRLDSWLNGLLTKEQYDLEMAWGNWIPELTFETWKTEIKIPQIDTNSTEDQIEISFTIPSVGDRSLEEIREEIISDLKTYLQNVGWFAKNVSSRHNRVTIVSEPRYGKRLEISEPLYHTTNVENLESIQRKGLVPRSRHLKEDYEYWGNQVARKYPKRIYLSLDLPSAQKMQEMLQTAETWASAGGDPEAFYYGQGDTPDYVLLKIDPDQLKPGTKFYVDPDYPEGVYTYTPIPASAIEVVNLD